MASHGPPVRQGDAVLVPPANSGLFVEKPFSAPGKLVSEGVHHLGGHEAVNFGHVLRKLADFAPGCCRCSSIFFSSLLWSDIVSDNGRTWCRTLVGHHVGSVIGLVFQRSPDSFCFRFQGPRLGGIAVVAVKVGDYKGAFTALQPANGDKSAGKSGAINHPVNVCVFGFQDTVLSIGISPRPKPPQFPQHKIRVIHVQYFRQLHHFGFVWRRAFNFDPVSGHIKKE